MIRLSVLGFLLIVLGTQTLQAGAWLRDAGAGFLSTSGTVTAERDLSGSLYGEYGLTDQLTLGLDVTAGIEETGLPQGDGTLFVRFPLSSQDAETKWAAHIGLGARYEPTEFFPSVEFGLSWGRGLQWRDQYGWAAIDATVNFAQSPMKPITKLDGTIGMGVSETSKVMGQIFFTYTDGELYTTLAPSFLYSPKNSQTTFQIGFEFPLQEDDDARIKLGIWRTF